MHISSLKVTGWGDAVRALYMSNKNYTPEIETKITQAEDVWTTLRNNILREKIFIENESVKEIYDWFEKCIDMVIKHGATEITLLRYVDASWVVNGLHRGAQDDFDAHAERFDNRIIRMSTRTVNDGKLAEVSDWYKDKILTFQDLSEIFNMPAELMKNGVAYERTPFGYIRQDTIGTPDERDVRRGLVPLAVSSTFIVKCQITELCHVYRMRNENTHASPELKQMIEEAIKEISRIHPKLDSEFFLTQCLQ